MLRLLLEKRLHADTDYIMFIMIVAMMIKITLKLIIVIYLRVKQFKSLPVHMKGHDQVFRTSPLQLMGWS